MVDLTELQNFLNKAAMEGYASNKGFTLKNGIKEMVFEDRLWTYSDAYSGYFRSAGSELVRHNNQPVWTNTYGGGMMEGFADAVFAHETFSFLKQALSSRGEEFQPRGPIEFEDGLFRYEQRTVGDISNFHGYEHIFYRGRLTGSPERIPVFEHRFFGGLIISK